jgi:hypothetical protein
MLAQPRPQPDPDPALAERVQQLIAQSANGALRAEDFESLRADTLSYMNERHKLRLQGMGPVNEVSLLERREIGDDLHVEYRARSGNKAFQCVASTG